MCVVSLHVHVTNFKLLFLLQPKVSLASLIQWVRMNCEHDSDSHTRRETLWQRIQQDFDVSHSDEDKHKTFSLLDKVFSSLWRDVTCSLVHAVKIYGGVKLKGERFE